MTVCKYLYISVLYDDFSLYEKQVETRRETE